MIDGSDMKVPLEDRLEMIRRAAESGAFHYRRTTWIENDVDGFTGWRWDKYNVKLDIVCAANRYKDLIIMGTRHTSPSMVMIQDLVGLDALMEYAGETEEEQGFVDQYGTFYDREEAMKLCRKNGRVLIDDNGGRHLFSEHIC